MAPVPLRREEPPPEPLGFRTYLSLGDSISIDLYPGLDAAEREGLPRMPPGLGAASLLHRNDDPRWPAFRGRDLATLYPGIRHVDLTEDGATTGTLLRRQLPRVPGTLEAPVLVTVTAGGNDLVALLNSGFRGSFERGAGGVNSASVPSPASTDEAARALVDDAARTLERAASDLRARFPEATLLIGDVYDPSDGTGDLGDGIRRPRELEALAAFNRRVVGVAAEVGARPVPIHDRFLGHGLSEPDPAARWYWRHNIIEPSAPGASEVRRLWLEALGA